MNKYLKDPKLVGTIVGLLAFGAGTGVGYILGKRKQKYIHAVPPQDWTEVNPNSSPDIEAVDKIVETEDEIELTRTPTAVSEPVHQNIFEEALEGWDYEVELEQRKEQEIYILHRDEFWSNEEGYNQSTLTYYESDDILVDQEDAPIYNYSNILGELKFGHGSGSPTTFYVRNEKLRAEYEVIKDPGHYSVEVLGLELEEDARVTEIEHSADRKFKLE